MLEVILLAIALAMDAFAVAIGLGASGLATQPKAKVSSLHNSAPTTPNANSITPIESVAFIALMAGLYFGMAQGIMPWLGYLLGAVMLGWLASLAPWIGCVILVGLGVKMIYEVYSNDDQSSSDADVNTSANPDTVSSTISSTTSSTVFNTVPNTIPSANADKQTDLTSQPAYTSVQKSVHKTMLTLAIATSIDAMGAGFTLNLLPVDAKIACLIIAIITAGLSGVGVYIGKLSGTWLEDKAELLGGLVLIGIGINMVV